MMSGISGKGERVNKDRMGNIMEAKMGVKMT